jgi:protein ImuB
MNGQLLQLPLGAKPLHTLLQRKRVQERTLTRQQKTAPLWYAICLPQLGEDSLSSELNQLGLSEGDKLQQIAEQLTSLSSRVSIEAPDCLVFEVRSSLKYFGGIEKIRNELEKIIQHQLKEWQLPLGFYQAATPTPAASLLLAKAGHNLLVYQQENLRSALGRLSVQTLPIDSNKQRKQLHNSGLRTLRDVWRLPTSALGQRFGLDFIKQLDRCLGKIAQPIQHYESAPIFSSEIDFDFALENTTLLLHGVQELIDRLAHFLQRRELATRHLRFELIHAQEKNKVLEIELRQASRSPKHLLMLAKTRLESLLLCAPVQTLRIHIERFEAFVPEERPLALFDDTLADNNDTTPIAPLLEQIQAKLGNSAVQKIYYRKEYAPEHASRHYIYGTKTPQDIASPSLSHLENSRPFWLLSDPTELTEQEGRLHYRSSLVLISGPERIETRWWSGEDIARDYYIARNRLGMRLWIYHERTGRRGWYLHGIFD